MQRYVRADDTTTEEEWLALPDPVLVAAALPGCEFLAEVEEENVDFDALREVHGDRDLEMADGDGERYHRSLTDRLLGRSRGDKI